MASSDSLDRQVPSDISTASAVPIDVSPAASLYIAIPAYTGQISVQTAHSLLAANQVLGAAGVQVTTDFLAGCCYLDHSRNILADRFLKSEASDLLFVDADVGFAPEAALRLAMAPRSVVAGIYPKKSHGDPEWPVDFDGDQLAVNQHGLVVAARVPTGFLRINRAVFQAFIDADMAPEYGRQDGDGTLRRFFHCPVREGVYWGEDFQFCEDWRSIGGAIYVIPEIDFEHVGTKTWRGNWGQWIKSTPPEVAAAAE